MGREVDVCTQLRGRLATTEDATLHGVKGSLALREFTTHSQTPLTRRFVGCHKMFTQQPVNHVKLLYRS